jgi:acyl-coenzyme A thioesterase PaaI-like protein
MHFYGHFVGIAGGWAEGGRSHLRLEGEPAGVGSPDVSTVALATLADLALGAAIRSWLDKGARLGTVTFTVQHPAAPVQGPLVADGRALFVADGRGAAQCSVSTPDGAVAQAQGWFSALPAPDGRALGVLPWERGEQSPVPPPSLDDLDEREARAVSAARAAGQRAAMHGTAVSHELLAFDWDAASDGRALGKLAIGPELSNRVGHLQGGVLYGAAAVAAARAAGLPPSAILDGHYQFLRPGDGECLTAEATVARRGRSVAFVESRLAVDGALIGLGLFTVRP